MAAKEPDPTPLDIAKGILDKLGCTTASYRLIVDIDPAERILEYAKTAEADMIVLGNRGMGMLREHEDFAICRMPRSDRKMIS